jgi:hypothetical protein
VDSVIVMVAADVGAPLLRATFHGIGGSHVAAVPELATCACGAWRVLGTLNGTHCLVSTCDCNSVDPDGPEMDTWREQRRALGLSDELPRVQVLQ